MINVEFVPPKPNELDRNILNCFSRVVVTKFSFALSSSGVCKLIFGAINPPKSGVK